MLPPIPLEELIENYGLFLGLAALLKDLAEDFFNFGSLVFY